MMCHQNGRSEQLMMHQQRAIFSYFGYFTPSKGRLLRVEVEVGVG